MYYPYKALLVAGLISMLATGTNYPQRVRPSAPERDGRVKSAVRDEFLIREPV